LSLREATSCVTNASLNVGTGVTGSTVSTTNGLIAAGVWVTTTAGAGEAVGGIPPNGVGVVYCPHREAFPAQDDSKKEAAIKKLISRFTKKSARGNYTFIKD
jgi:hypothetical protein